MVVKKVKTITRVFIAALVVMVAYLSIAGLLRIYRADVYYKKSQALLDGGSIQKALYYASKAIDFNPLEPNYYRGRARILVMAIYEDKNAHILQEYKRRVFADLNKALRLNPDNLVTIRNSIPIMYFALAVGDSNSNLPDKSIVEDFYERAKKRFANDAGVVALIAKYEKKLGMQSQYEESVEMIKELRPDLLDWHDSFK